MTENQQTKKTKKIKVIIAIILSMVTILGGAFISISIIKTSHIMKINTPDKIIVYYNSSSNNVVYEPDDNTYHKIYQMINNAHKQTILTSVFNGQLFKDVKIIEHSSKPVKFDGIKVSFIYNTPQIAKLENKIYPNQVWYQNLMFEISSEDTFNYNRVAIISPESNSTTFSYKSHYLTYSNYCELYNYLSSISK